MTQDIAKRHPLALIAILMVIVAIAAGAVHMKHVADERVENSSAAQVEQAVPVEVAIVSRVILPRQIQVRGFLRGIEEITVYSQVTGRVDDRPLEDGQQLGEGDVLLRIDDTDYRLHCERAGAELTRAQAQLEDVQAGMDQAAAQLEAAEAVRNNQNEEFTRIEDLLSGGHASKLEYDRIETAYRTAQADYVAAKAALARVKAQYATAEGTVAIAQAALREARTSFERCIVNSPVTGRVNHYFIERGEYAIAGAPIVELIRLDKMKMIVQVSGQEVPLLEEFAKAVVIADAFPDRDYAARLHHVSPKMDPTTRKFEVELQVDNENESLLSGMYGQATLFCGQMQGVDLIPREAVFKHFGVDYCLVAVQAKDCVRASLRRIEVEDIVGQLESVRVLSGLQEGESVIVSRRRELRDGVQVDIGKTRPAVEAIPEVPNRS